MKRRPKEFVVRFADPSRRRDYVEREFDSLDAAAKANKRLQGWGVWRRANITDVTPPGDVPGTLWDWEETQVL